MDTASTGPDGLDCALTGIYDAIILDVMLPGMDVFSVLSALRAQKISTPVLMLTARGDLQDRVQGLNLGADYYLPKPFERSELVAGLNAITRRKDAPPVQALIVAMDVSPEDGYAASLLRITLIARMDAGRRSASFARFDLGAALLGLALPMESIAELHHGEILVESDPQTGTAFTAILPNQGE